MLTTLNFENIATFYHQTQNLRDYSWPFYAVSDILRLFAAIPSAILFIGGYMQESNLIYLKKKVYSVNNEDKYMIAFNRTNWKLCDYSWRFISRMRLLAAASVYLRHFLTICS